MLDDNGYVLISEEKGDTGESMGFESLERKNVLELSTSLENVLKLEN